MSASGFTLRLEFVANRSGCEPVELAQEFSVDQYKVGNPANVQGTAIVGVELIPHAGATPPSYRFYRVEAATTPQLDDPQAAIKCTGIKLRWDDPAQLEPSISAYYTSRFVEKTDPSIPAAPADGRWLLVLKRNNGENHLVYQLDSGGGTGDPCADLLAAGIDCVNTTVNGQKMTCRMRGCPV